MFIHDFAEVAVPFDVLEGLVADLPRILSALVGQSFDLTMVGASYEWPVLCGPIYQRADGVVRSVTWEAGRSGLIPAIDADIGVFPGGGSTSHIEIMGTYRAPADLISPEVSRAVHYRAVMGVRRLLQAVAHQLGPDPIPVQSVRLAR